MSLSNLKIKKENNFFLCNSEELEKKYAGKYIAVVEDKVIAVGENRLKVYNKIKTKYPKKKKIGIFYLPLQEEILTAL